MKDGFKIIGIACDDYKLLHYRKELDEKQYQYDVKPGVTKDTRLIQVKVLAENFDTVQELVGRLCRKLEYSKPWKS